MAIGDNWNDLEMLEFAGRAVVVVNGAPDLVDLARQRKWEIAAAADEDGVAQVIEKLLAADKFIEVSEPIVNTTPVTAYPSTRE